jgi:hypothetical protein
MVMNKEPENKNPRMYKDYDTFRELYPVFGPVDLKMSGGVMAISGFLSIIKECGCDMETYQRYFNVIDDFSDYLGMYKRINLDRLHKNFPSELKDVIKNIQGMIPGFQDQWKLVKDCYSESEGIPMIVHGIVDNLISMTDRIGEYSMEFGNNPLYLKYKDSMTENKRNEVVSGLEKTLLGLNTGIENAINK